MVSTAEWLEGMKASTIDEIHARNVAIEASSTAQPYKLGDWKIEKPPKKVRTRAVHELVIHIAPDIGNVAPVALCGSTRGRAAKDPATTKLVLDRWCSRCWNRWAKEKA